MLTGVQLESERVWKNEEKWTDVCDN